MNLELWRSFLGWCAVANISLLFLWFLLFCFQRDFIYRVHSRWFRLSDEMFDVLQYVLFGFYKIVVFVFIVIPYFVLVMLR